MAHRSTTIQRWIKRITLIVPADLHSRFKAATESNGDNMNDALLDFMSFYVERQGQKKNRQPAAKSSK